ncbi:ferrous iron transport protein A [Tumebacillus algifaecis]|uniref:Ferrous iron transport protein A n=1 Tax=Tumebacillus algifaecis TaxID=1214604 RepID=A0A223D4A6_9BACL|nr:FeoA family protein [Tumebacillus algifaecis]ASS76421.1 ferrous iron transport protein A [Tumebacillus algifaecis]
MEIIPLPDLLIGERARVVSLNATGAQRRRMLDLGLVPQAVIEALRKSPAGDPVAYRIRGAVIALRREEASLVMVTRI